MKNQAKVITPEMLESMRKLLRDKVAVREIARRLGMSPATATRIIRKHIWNMEPKK